MNFLLLLITLLSAVTSCLALGSGAPTSACSSLLPVHRGTSLQQGNAPYTVSAHKIAANKVRVTISSPIGEEIKGFMLQARSSDSEKFIPGEFKSDEESKAIDCFNRKKSTLTHVNPEAKSEVVTEWTATEALNDVDVIFRATVAKSYAVYWKDIDSQPVKIRSGGGMSSSERKSNALSIYDACFKSKGCFGTTENCVDRGDCEVLFTYEKYRDGGIRFSMHGLLEPSEYMAMALSDDDKMGEDFVTECFRDRSNNGVLRNSWNEGKRNTRTTETSENYDFTVRNGLTTCVWTKPYIINTNGRTYDLSNETYYILLARGPVQNNGLRYHSSRLASSEAVNFTAVGAVSSGGGSTDSVKIHGTFMVTGWIGFVSIAILLARHFKNVWENSTLGGVKIWFALHRAFMITALVFIIIAFIVIFVHKNGWNYQTSNPHAILGCIATCLGVLNPIMALFRPAPDHPKRMIFNWLHWAVGNGAQIIAVITIFFAVSLPSAGLTTSFYWVMAVFVIVHLIFHFLYQAHAWTQGKKKSNELSMNEMNGARTNGAQNGGHNSQAKKISADVFRILLLGIYCIFLLIILIALYALIGVA